MKNKMQKFKLILEKIGLEGDKRFLDGAIDALTITNDGRKWEIKLIFPSILPIASYQLLVNSFQEHFKEIDSVLVKIDYLDKNITNEVLEEYFLQILEKACLDRPRCSALKAFTTNFTSNKITIYVGSEEEVKMVEELTASIQNQFNEYQLEQIVIEAKISPFETPIEKTIAQNLKEATKAALKEQERYELIQNAKNNQSPKEKVFKRRRQQAEINGEVTPLNKVPASEVQIIEHQQKVGKREFVVSGEIVKASIRNIKEYKIYEALLFDGTDSIIIKTFVSNNNYNNEDFYQTYCQAGMLVRVFGYIEFDRYSRDVVLRIKDIVGLGKAPVQKKNDNAPRKRVELHAHTKMSTLDGVMDVQEYVKTALEYGHSAIAVTDHYNMQSLPELSLLTSKTDLKPIYGVEGAMVDEANFKVALTDRNIDLDEATYVVYDLETTGLSSNYDEIIEIAAVKIHKGTFIEEFSSFVKPKRDIPSHITEITSITNDDVRNAPSIEEIMPKFKTFFEGSILVAHNASFDNSYLYKNLRDLNLYDGELPTIDTMQLARIRYGNKLKTFNLKSLIKYFDVELTQHHRAIYDAKATAEVFLRMLTELKESKIYNYNQINQSINPDEAFSQVYPTHINILATNLLGLKNLNKIVTDSHTVHFSKEARMLKSVLEENREGLLFGSSCCNGEVFDIALRDSYEKLLKAVEFYDYLEIQPISHYRHLFDGVDEEFEIACIKDAIMKIIKAGQEKGKIVVATGDVHILSKEDLRFREIFINAPQVGGGVHRLYNLKNIASQHFMNTEEMLEEFQFLGPELAEEVVIDNTNKIADMIENFPLFPDKLYAPSDDFLKDRGVPSFKEAVYDLTYKKARDIYGNPIPEYINSRLKKELDSIINNNYASIYYISHLLVEHSLNAGYVVGSRGSVGSSLVAFFMGITEVNALAPHYYCPKCNFSAFKMTKEEKTRFPQTAEALALDAILQKVGTGYDLPDQKCPHCEANLGKDGCDIPFETFLGFEGDKVPDIDLNFSGEYQSQAHEFCRELFGYDNAFRAGTISTIADKSAYGYVKGYLERKGLEARHCEIARLADKITGVKRSTGQHPGGIVVIPKEIEYYDIIPVQYPADDLNSPWRTTHYDYHKFEANLLKLDILGHDDPTMIRHLMDFVEAEPEVFPFKTVEEIPLAEPKVLAIFSGLSSLGVDSSQVNETVGTTGIPEFGTTLSKDMLNEIRPTTVNELIKISGLSHGTDVWNGNARDYLLGLKEGNEPIPFQDLIGCRDDIMVYLMSKGLAAADAFKIMESVRKGRGVSPEQEKEMLAAKVPAWYIESCKLIKYMFPKAHAAAYVIMALRIAWFKVHRPLYYYAAYFSRRAKDFDIQTMVGGYTSIKTKVNELEEKINKKTASAKDNDIYNCLLLALEMTARGYSFKQINIFQSDWRDFLIEGSSLIIPFKAMDSLGEATAKSITDARSEMMFTSKKDIMRRTKINTTLYERLEQINAFEGLPDDDQIGLF